MSITSNQQTNLKVYDFRDYEKVNFLSSIAIMKLAQECLIKSDLNGMRFNTSYMDGVLESDYWLTITLSIAEPNSDKFRFIVGQETPQEKRKEALIKYGLSVMNADKIMALFELLPPEYSIQVSREKY
jgi:hypothetical protein